MPTTAPKFSGPSQTGTTDHTFTKTGGATSPHIRPIPCHSRGGQTIPDELSAPHLDYHCHGDPDFLAHTCPTANGHTCAYGTTNRHAGLDTDPNTRANYDSSAHADGGSNGLSYRHTVCFGNFGANPGNAPDRDAYPIPCSNANSSPNCDSNTFICPNSGAYNASDASPIGHTDFGPYPNAHTFTHANSGSNCDSNTFICPNSGAYSNASPIAHTDLGPYPNAHTFTHANSGCNCDSDTCTNGDSHAHRDTSPNRRANAHTYTGTRSRRMPGRTSGHQFCPGRRIGQDQTYRSRTCTTDVRVKAF